MFFDLSLNVTFIPSQIFLQSSDEPWSSSQGRGQVRAALFGLRRCHQLLLVLGHDGKQILHITVNDNF
jgi:hypothetical protein